MTLGSTLRALSEAALLLGLLALATLPDGFVLRPKLLWGQSLVLLALGLAALSLAATARSPRPWGRALALALLPAGLALLHLIHSTPASHALARDEIRRLLVVPLVAAAVGALICRSERARSRLLLALALGTAWAAVHAVLQRTGAVFSLGVTPRLRAEGGFSNPVFLGGWLVLTTPLLLMETLFGRGPLRWLCALAAGFALPALLGTKSVGAWAGLGVACFVALVLALRASRLRQRLLVGGIVVGLVLAVAGRDSLARSRQHTLIWRDTLAMVGAHPAGVGPGQFHLAFPSYASAELREAYPPERVIINDAHSEPLQLAAELGWTGLGAALLALVAGALAVRRTRRELDAAAVPDAHRFHAVVAGVAGSVAMSCVSPDLRFGVTTLAFATLCGIAIGFEPLSARPLPGGRVGRALALLLGLALLTHTAHDLERRLDILRLSRPAPQAAPNPEALELLAPARAAAAQAPDDPAVQAQLGLVLEALRRHGEAARCFERALKHLPNDPQLTRRLAINGVLAGAYDNALPYLDQALEHTPQDNDLRYLLAFAHYGRGNLLGSLQEVERILETDPEHAKARVLLEGLRE
ncbi:MAG: hypothetical protein DHS20C15_16320 [Planctomycetota bacterium]|nr:MAG: hypothetical protein DHS20C15_16320 [Planctomycetota bacterium]